MLTKKKRPIHGDICVLHFGMKRKGSKKEKEKSKKKKGKKIKELCWKRNVFLIRQKLRTRMKR
jgi:hypothetical protein